MSAVSCRMLQLAAAAPMARPVPSFDEVQEISPSKISFTHGHVRSSPSTRRRYTQLLRYSTHQAAREQRPRRSRNELIQGPLSNLRVLTAHASACSMKVPSRVPQGDQQTVLHSGDAAQSVPVDMGVGWLTAQFLWYQTVSTDATELL